MFLQHDLNVFNFIIQLNISLREQGRDLTPVERPDFSMISDAPFALGPLPKRPLNFVDAQTAIEFYTPLYALMLPRDDFVRAVNSLQLDETVAVYIAKILGTDYHLAFIEERPPAGADVDHARPGYWLMMHGLDCRGAARLAADAEGAAGGGTADRSADADGGGLGPLCTSPKRQGLRRLSEAGRLSFKHRRGKPPLPLAGEVRRGLRPPVGRTGVGPGGRRGPPLARRVRCGCPGRLPGRRPSPRCGRP